MTGEGNGHYCYEEYGEVPDFFDFDNTYGLTSISNFYIKRLMIVFVC